jgi:hypothetical protein
MNIKIDIELLQLLNAFSILQDVYEKVQEDNFANDLLEDFLNEIREQVTEFYKKNEVTKEQLDMLFDTNQLLFNISRNLN